MNILVISGSPKGVNSISLHTCLYLEKKFPQLSFSYIHAGTRIRALEKDFTPALEAIRSADVLLFCYPVYTFLVPYQLHRFIELMKASGEDFSGKAATQFSTSKHFYDITAHRFIKDNCSDLGMRGLMRADHEFFKSHGQYDFPQKKWKTSLSMYLVGALMRNRKLRAKAGGKFTEGMIGPYRKAVVGEEE